MAENPITAEVLRLSNEAVDAEILKAITQYAELDGQSEKITAKRTKIREKMEKDHGYSSLAFQEVVRKVKKMTTEERLAHEEQVARGLRVAGVLKQSELWPEMAKKADARKAKREKAAAKKAAKDATKTAEDIERGDPKRGGAGGAKGRGKAKDAPAKPVEPKVTGRRGRRPGKPPAQEAADRAEERAEQAGRLRAAQDASPGSAPGTLAGTVAAGDALIASTAAELNAKNEQTDGGQILDEHIDAMKDGQGLTGKTGLGSIADEKPLSQSAQVAAIQDKLGLNK